MKRIKKMTALLLALAMALSLAACKTGGATTSDASTPNSEAGTAELEELGSGDVKWQEETTADGWIKITNEGGATLGYSKDSGVSLLQSNGYAFKDLNRNGELDPYEDWRLDYETRARDLASQMSGEEIAPYLTHGGWGTFTTEKSIFQSDDNTGYAYILGGGRGGVTRNLGATVEENVDHAIWVNMIQELCESLDYGIPALVSIDPNSQSDLVNGPALAATMDTELALEVGKAYSEQYRAAGVSALLGPQIDLMTTPNMDRGGGVFSEDPALTRDIAEAYVSGMQSSWDGDTDLGWGSDSVLTIMKHYSGAGAGEAGRDDHYDTGRFSVFPSDDSYEAHLIPFHDGAFNLTHSSTGSAGGVMMNYSISYSKDGSLGELVAGAWSEWKYDTLFSSGWTGFIISDWGPISGGQGAWGMEEDYTDAERAARAIELGMCSMGGYGDLDAMQEAWELLVDELGENEALSMMQDRAYENILVSMRLGLFENPYNSTEHVREVCWTDEAQSFGVDSQTASVVMLKNSNDVIHEADASSDEKLTVYIPYHYTASWSKRTRVYPATCEPSVDLELASQYYNVVTDSVKDPSGPADEKGNPTYTEDDIVRASKEEIAKCDMILVGMQAPHTASTVVTDENGVDTWLPASIQYTTYTADTAKETSVGGKLITETFNDGYTQQTKVTTENRSYKGNTAAEPYTAPHLTTLQWANEVAGDTPVVVLMNMYRAGAMVFSEVEPLADAIVVGFSICTSNAATAVGDEAMLRVVAGVYEPTGLLPAQMPASMEAVEAQADDLPRDMECYVDSDGNVYDFAFGLNWSGKIDDDRVKTYSVAPLTECENLDFKYANE